MMLFIFILSDKAGWATFLNDKSEQHAHVKSALNILAGVLFYKACVNIFLY